MSGTPFKRVQYVGQPLEKDQDHALTQELSAISICDDTPGENHLVPSTVSQGLVPTSGTSADKGVSGFSGETFETEEAEEAENVDKLTATNTYSKRGDGLCVGVPSVKPNDVENLATNASVPLDALGHDSMLLAAADEELPKLETSSNSQDSGTVSVGAIKKTLNPAGSMMPSATVLKIREQLSVEVPRMELSVNGGDGHADKGSDKVKAVGTSTGTETTMVPTAAQKLHEHLPLEAPDMEKIGGGAVGNRAKCSDGGKYFETPIETETALAPMMTAGARKMQIINWTHDGAPINETLAEQSIWAYQKQGEVWQQCLAYISSVDENVKEEILRRLDYGDEIGYIAMIIEDLLYQDLAKSFKEVTHLG